MKEEITMDPNYLFEISWEVCNKIGGIHTVLATRAALLRDKFADKYITIGPDLWQHKENPEFVQDDALFPSWLARTKEEGLRVRTGYWNIKGKPIAILVDFSHYISEKNEILTYYWNTQQLDSLNASWDFTESALFGYAVGKVLESFIRFQVGVRERAIAHFHEWMSGTALLYLKQEVPQVGTVFTTHATVLGRSIAGNGWALYNYLEEYKPAELAYRFSVQHKHFLEAKAACQADVFTTVSDITAREAAHFLGRIPEVVTPNGFDEGHIRDRTSFLEKHKRAAAKLQEVAQKVTGTTFEKKPFFVAISGRNEFRNKGIDVFIDALQEINKDATFDREVVAFILIPSAYEGTNTVGQTYTTHLVTDEYHNTIISKLKEAQLFNQLQDKVKVVYCPSYLLGNDGVFDLSYYDLLTGIDLTVFPSYYEPWGYTPFESLCFGVPTITTTLAGFGSWALAHFPNENLALKVLRRDDSNYQEVVVGVVSQIEKIARLSPTAYGALWEDAQQIGKAALWDKFFVYYQKAYELTLNKLQPRLANLPIADTDVEVWEQSKVVNTPFWRSVIVHRATPEKFKALEELAKNLWWCWNEEAEQLFKSIDPEEWRRVHKNPILLLDSISLSKFKALENDATFMTRLDKVYKDFLTYMEKKKEMTNPSIAYFSMEFGLHSSLKIYSGGLGILAGDYLKEASDKATKITGVGLLYRYGYFTQKISAFGNQESEYEAQDFTKIPVSPVLDKDGKWLKISLALPGRTLYARVWRVDVGRIELYLLDTDYEDNNEEDRTITHHLYGGNWENRLKQEMLLGLGGIKVLRNLGVSYDIYHCNEGHAALIGLERLNKFINEHHLSFSEAVEVVRASSLFTTHTPVPAGHDAFEETMLRAFIGDYAEKLHVDWQQILSLGKINVNDPHEKFSMSFLAANLSQEVNGVSMLHGEVSRDIFKDMWKGYLPEELHISYVTNGVHRPTWTSPLWKEVEEKYFKKEAGAYTEASFEGIYDVPDEKVAQIKQELRSKLIRRIKHNLTDSQNVTYFTPREIVEVFDSLRDDVLTIGFARRFATYKRAHLLFTNLDRLDAIINNPERPVQFIFAGKAHPADKAGQDLIKHIVEISKQPRFLGKIIFLSNYDMDLARTLIQGVDVWMNTPTRPLEASGTSGEKAAMNGVMHFSVLDGWWVEGYREDAGWMLPQKRTYENQKYQDELDAELIYNIIEDQIAPAFYNKDKEGKGISIEWCNFIKNTIGKVAPKFTTYRMLTDYENQYYYPQQKRSKLLRANNFEKAIALSQWKKKVSQEWAHIRVEKVVAPKRDSELISLGKKYEATIDLYLSELTPEDVGLELVVTHKEEGTLKVDQLIQAELISFYDRVATYKLSTATEGAGLFMIALRLYPKHELLPHRQDFPLVKWL
ncbi:alpha-glucan family phosphorylase [Capnocytophaga granulosa]|uniref:alpha-glucan family phosphorylase n=1 Tax=Capnocytophaga granulosa TaxID=45242 RepID=UPI0023F053D2|nr:alpha-glucan family phosphorylase [Capnocytophaga granulosa]